MKKYEILQHNSIQLPTGEKLYRIRAVRGFAGVRAGELGGYIQKEENLSQQNEAWVFDDAWVSDDAQVYGDAKVYGNAWVAGNARVYDNAWVYDNARVYGGARVYGNAMVYGNAHVFSRTQVSGDARIFGAAKDSDNIWTSEKLENKCPVMAEVYPLMEKLERQGQQLLERVEELEERSKGKKGFCCFGFLGKNKGGRRYDY